MFPGTGQHTYSTYKFTKVDFGPYIKYISDPFWLIFAAGKASIVTIIN